MRFLSRTIEDAFNMTVQRSHHAYPRKHRWPAMLCNKKQCLGGGLPFRRFALGLFSFGTNVAGKAWYRTTGCQMRPPASDE